MWRTVSDHLLNTTDADLTIMETAAFKKSMYIPSPTSVPPPTEYMYISYNNICVFKVYFI